MKKGYWIAGGAIAFFMLLCAGCGGAFFYWIYNSTQQAVDATDQFLAQVANDDFAGAYNSTTAQYQQAQSLEEFTQSMKDMGLTNYSSSSFLSRNILNNEATIKGEITTNKGTIVPLTVVLIKELNVWHVSTISNSTVSVGAGTKSIPTVEKLNELATATLLEFDKGVAQRDFANFHGQLSRPFQDQKTVAELNQIFKEFIDKQINVSVVEEETPIFTEPPAIDGDGVLVLVGYYPTKPARVEFTLKYVYEHPEWKLLAINVETKVGDQ